MKYNIEDLKEYLYSPDQRNVELAFTVAPKECEAYCKQFQWLVDLGKIKRCREALCLRELDFWGNKLTQLPDGIGNLTNLTKLNFWDNKLTQLPESIGDLTKLRYLDLYSNQLTKLPESIGKLTNLTGLDLRYNYIPDTERQRIKKALPNCNVYF